MATTIVTYKKSRFEIAYEIRNPRAERDLVILHGWGSNKEIMMRAFEGLLPQMRHIYIDLPGFGKSSNETILSTQDYASIIDLFLRQKGFQKEIVMGHSFGGKVALLLEPKLLVLLASAGILWPKPLGVRAKIALYKLLKPFGKGLRRFFASKDVQGMSEVMYETFKQVVDEDFAPYFASFGGEALLFWGRDDSATPLKSAHRIKELMPQSKLFVYEGDHYFFLEHAPKIAKEIECIAAAVS